MTDENINITINDQTISVKKGTTVYQAAKEIGVDIPIFCYQDRMPPFGACRMCLVEVEKMPKLQASCTLIATDGMSVKTESLKAVEGRKGIVELLLINHPLDCPICDKGGECPLQENALSHGPGKSQFFEDKRHFSKALPLGPVLMLDRERCIVCARCTRFGETIAGDHALEFIERGYRTEVGTPHGGPAESKFIGNTIQICPVGALTSQVYRFRARPWDNDSATSTCTLCPVGCSMIFDSRDGQIMRTRSDENKKVNDIWLCDKGFFGYQFTSDPKRLTKPLIRKNGQLVEATYDEAFSLIVSKLQESKKIAAFGGNPLTVEENFLYNKLMRDVLQTNNIDHRIGMPNLGNQVLNPGMETSLAECEDLKYIFLCGIDLTEEFPVIWLRLRQSINREAKVFFIGHYKPEIDTYMTENLLFSPNVEFSGQELTNLISKYKVSGKGAIFVGRQYLETKQRSHVLQELIKVKEQTPSLQLNVMEASENSMGASFVKQSFDGQGFNSLEVLLESAKSGTNSGWDFLYVAGANPVTKFSTNLFKQAKANLKFLVVQDIFMTETAEIADVVLPTLCYVEKGGSFINIEGRIQKLQPGCMVPDGIYSDGDIFKILAERLGKPLKEDVDFQDAMQKEFVKFEVNKNPNEIKPFKKEEGKLSATFSKALFDHGVRMQHNTHLVKLAKKPNFRLNESEGKKYGLQKGDLVELSVSGNSVQGTIEIDHRVADETIVLPLGFPEVPVYDLANELYNGLMVNIKKL